MGRWINPLINEQQIKQKIEALFLSDIDIVEKSKLNGFMKLWLYQFYILQRLSWPFIINDLSLSFALSLQRSINVKLKKWAGVYQSVDNTLLYRSKKKFGLGLTAVTDHYQRMQLVKCELLRHSKDPVIQKLFKTREQLNAKMSRVWKATNVSLIANAEVELNLKFPSQQGQWGIGFGNFNPVPTLAEKRKLVTTKAAEYSQEKLDSHSISLKQQSV